MSSLVIGIDPGLTRCGYAMLSGGLRNLQVENVGVSATDLDVSHEQRLLQHFKFFDAMFKELIRPELTQTNARDETSSLSEVSAKIDSFSSKTSPPNARPRIHVSIERPFLTAHNPDTGFGTAQVAGLVMVIAAKYGFTVHLYTPAQVKSAVTGSGAAGKQQIIAALKKILAVEDLPKPVDASDALAIALTHRLRAKSASQLMHAADMSAKKSVGQSTGQKNAAPANSETPVQKLWKSAAARNSSSTSLNKVVRGRKM